MYRVVLYTLVFFFLSAFALSLFKLLPYTPIELTISLIIILTLSYLANTLFAYLFDATTNVESTYITAFILFFLINPVQNGQYGKFLTFAACASIFAMGSKYILAIKKKHIFNPVAVALVITAFTINQSASWWIGTFNMLPFVLIGGLLITRKLRRGDALFTFILSSLVTITTFALIKDLDISGTLIDTMRNSPFFFFAFIMLTEPMTAPTTKWFRIAFAAIVGFLFAPFIHIGSIYSTPELALVLGNVFAYIVSPKEKLFLKLKTKIKIAKDTYDFAFDRKNNLNFKPGQYMEWTLAHNKSDTRGNRRYFTIASSPTEDEIHLGIKFYPEPSSFKNKLLSLQNGEEIIAAQKSGDFVLPKEKNLGLVFIAGGIGITPFRSMVQYLLDVKEKRQITLLYSNRTVEDIAYKEIFDRASMELGLKTIYAITENTQTVLEKNMYVGMINSELIKKEVPEYVKKIFYISGPHGMVNAFEATLKGMGVPNKNIKIDFFPGFA